MNDVNGLADIILGKQRHGPTGTIKVEFEGIYTKFKDLSKIKLKFFFVIKKIKISALSRCCLLLQKLVIDYSKLSLLLLAIFVIFQFINQKILI